MFLHFLIAINTEVQPGRDLNEALNVRKFLSAHASAGVCLLNLHPLPDCDVSGTSYEHLPSLFPS